MEEKTYLKWYNKVGYGSGDIAGNVVYAFLSSFVMIYLTNTIGLSAGVVGTLIAVSKLFDGFTDIFFGSMIDRTHTRLGKARPWMLYGYIGCAVTLAAIFAVPTSWGETAQYAWFFIAYTLLNGVFYTANNIAYSALTSLVTKNNKERVQMGSWRFIFAFGTSLLIQSVTIGFVAWCGGGAAAWRTVAIVYALIGLCVNTLSALSVRELSDEELASEERTGEQKSTEGVKSAAPAGESTGRQESAVLAAEERTGEQESTESVMSAAPSGESAGVQGAPALAEELLQQAGEEKVGLGEAFKLLIANKFYLMICGVYILQQLYGAMINAGIYYMTYVLKNENLYGVFSWAVNIPLILALVFTPTLVGMWKGMYKLNMRGYMIAVLGRGLVVVAGYLGSVPLMLLFTAVAALGQGPWQGDMNAVIASCSEYTFLTRGKRVDGTMYSCTSLGVKLGGGLGTAIAGWLLELSGFDGMQAVQPESCINMLYFMYLWLPFVIDLIILVVLSQMNVEETNERIKSGGVQSAS